MVTFARSHSSAGRFTLFSRALLWRSIVILFALMAVNCSDNTFSSGTSPTGTPAFISLAVTIVSTDNPPTASIVATVRDSGELVVSGIAVSFTTTAGFITSGATTSNDGVAVAILTGAPGLSATVTATASSGSQTVTKSTVVRF
jgi:hypothetical protein